MGLSDLFAKHSGEEQAAEVHTINVVGMHCGGCEKRVSVELSDRGATNVTASHETGVVTFEGDLADDKVKEAVEAAGFTLA